MINIVIPVYQKSERTSELLSAILSYLNAQKYKDFKVIINDTSEGKDYSEDISKIKEVDVTYYKNPINCNMAKNLNSAMEYAKEEIIVINQLDTYFPYKDSLQKIADNFDKNIGWMVSSYMHTRDRLGLFKRHVPQWNNEIYLNNTIGTSSCLSFLNEGHLLLDENLTWLVDCEYYYQLYKKYGLPKLLKGTIFAQLLWDNPNMHPADLAQQFKTEEAYIKNKYFESKVDTKNEDIQ